MKSLLSATTFGLLPLPLPLPHAIDLDRRQVADLGGSQPHPEAEATTPKGDCEDKGRMRRHAAFRGPPTTF
jgi:hypothetical protein